MVAPLPPAPVVRHARHGQDIRPFAVAAPVVDPGSVRPTIELPRTCAGSGIRLSLEARHAASGMAMQPAVHSHASSPKSTLQDKRYRKWIPAIRRNRSRLRRCRKPRLAEDLWREVLMTERGFTGHQGLMVRQPCSMSACFSPPIFPARVTGVQSRTSRAGTTGRNTPGRLEPEAPAHWNPRAARLPARRRQRHRPRPASPQARGH